MSDKWEIAALINELNKYTEAYDAGHPQISDKEWDELYFQLVEMEKETGVIFADSPTQKVHFKKISKLNKVKHNHLMLSLDKTKNPNDIVSFVKGHDWLGMFKMDGLTVSLTYENGKLVRAETRGDGIEGEDVTHNAFVIDSIPKTIPTKDIGCYLYDIKDKVVIDGEIICTYSDFEPFEAEYKNPRNFASGSIRLLDSAECASRNLTFIAWDLIEGIDEDFFFRRLEKLDDWGFFTVPRVGDAETVEDAISILDSMQEDEYYRDIPIDGYVFKFESVEYGKSLGRTDHHFKNGIAYKFYNEEYETRLKYIDYDVSRNGILTPVAVFDPIEIEGSIVERASLHNISVMKEILGETPYVGEKVWVIKSNQIIPQITRADKKDYGDIIAAGGVTVGLGGDYGVLCPICGGLTSIKTSESGVEVLYCENEECPGKLAQRIDHFCGKKGLDIKGLSRKTIEKLIDWGWIDGLGDIFKLDKHKTEWISKTGFGEASVGKILSAITSARASTSLESFISAIGIPLVGKTVSKEIIKYYSTWEDFRNAIGGDWTEFDGFGPEISKAINSFNYSEADEVVKFLIFSNKQENDKETNEKVKDLIFVITGKLSRKRDDIKTDIEKCGGKVTGSVSSKTNYLVCNDKNSTTGKSADAKRLGISIITEEELMKLIK